MTVRSVSSQTIISLAAPAPRSSCQVSSVLLGTRTSPGAKLTADGSGRGVPAGSSNSASSLAGPEANGPARYRKLRLHARGGLGEVHVALDEELNREVALKEIQDRFADQADNRARFLREGEVTAQLEHPGIVPVYGLGQYSDGRPFYAMRFIRGASLHDAIKQFHHPRPQAARTRG